MTRLSAVITAAFLLALIASPLAGAQPVPEQRNRMRLDVESLSPRVITAATPTVSVTGALSPGSSLAITETNGDRAGSTNRPARSCSFCSVFSTSPRCSWILTSLIRRSPVLVTLPVTVTTAVAAVITRGLSESTSRRIRLGGSGTGCAVARGVATSASRIAAMIMAE